MTDKPARPILKLKFPPAVKPVAPPPPPPAKAEAAVKAPWRCKPCGGPVTVPADADPASDVRCPACNANLGKAASFLSDPPEVSKVRARYLG
jgi:hypothetical protein